MTGSSAQMLGMVSDCQDDRQGAAVGRIVQLTMIHNVGTSDAQSLFFSKGVLAYTKRNDTCSTCFVPLLI